MNFSSLWHSCVAIQPGICRIRPESHMVNFLLVWLKLGVVTMALSFKTLSLCNIASNVYCDF